jgi:hypothetical protein
MGSIPSQKQPSLSRPLGSGGQFAKRTSSSRIGGVASERFIDEGHVEMPTNPAAIDEIRRILLDR